MLTRESLAFDDRGDALAPPLRGRSRSCCSVAETDRVVEVATPEGAAPDRNSSVESVAASSSLVTVTEEPFVVATELPVGSADLG